MKKIAKLYTKPDYIWSRPEKEKIKELWKSNGFNNLGKLQFLSKGVEGGSIKVVSRNLGYMTYRSKLRIKDFAKILVPLGYIFFEPSYQSHRFRIRPYEVAEITPELLRTLGVELAEKGQPDNLTFEEFLYSRLSYALQHDEINLLLTKAQLKEVEAIYTQEVNLNEDRNFARSRETQVTIEQEEDSWKITQTYKFNPAPWTTPKPPISDRPELPEPTTGGILSTYFLLQDLFSQGATIEIEFRYLAGKTNYELLLEEVVRDLLSHLENL